ncbi:MAG: putative butanol dehydrogenase, nadph-dependent [Firmicutes bacterium]|nr:putative butanol dehydrogenase, nadph-dependent [Bacillota bacterium]
MKNLKFGGDAIITGSGSLKYLENYKNMRVFIVTGGSSMFKNGTIDRIKAILVENCCDMYIHSGVKANPDTEDVKAGLEAVNSFKPDVLIAVGGGSAIDLGKVLSIMHENPELDIEKMASVKLPDKRKYLKLVAIPSTSGTGSEVTTAAVITYRKHDIKIGLKSMAMIPDAAILDPDITMSMPDNIVAETGMDALTHAVECFINAKVDDFTGCLAKGAIEGILEQLPLSYAEKTLASREKMHNFQCMAGLAFTNTGLGMSHGIAHAIGGKFGLGHGLTNAVALPYVLEFNSRSPEVELRLRELTRAAGTDFISAVRELNEKMNVPGTFREAGINERDFFRNFDELVENSMMGSTRSNPVKISRDEMAGLLRDMYSGRRE